MPVQMVGRKVEHHRHVRAEIVNAFQLKAAQLGDKPRAGLGVVHRRAQGIADVAAHKGGEPGGLQHVAQQRGGGGLAVRSGNAHQRSFQKPGGGLDFRINGNHPLARRLKLRQVPGHAGADHDELVPQKRFLALRPEFQPDFILEELRQEVAKFRRGLASVTVTTAPRRARARATASPLRARPTTSTRLF